MNKIIVAALLVGISGTALMAAPAALNLGALPTEIQAKIKAAQEKAGADSNPVTKFVKNAEKSVPAYKNEVNALEKDNPYLNKNDTAKALINTLNLAYTNIDSSAKELEGAEENAQTLESNLSAAQSAYEALVQQTFPYACVNYAGTPVKGFVRPKLGSRTDWAFYEGFSNETKQTEFYKRGGYYEVGTIGKATEDAFVISSVRNSYVNAIKGPDGTGKEVIVCIGSVIPIPPSSKTVPAQK